MNIVVFGAGVIGSLYVAKLLLHHSVMVVVWAAYAEAIACDGLRVVGCESFICRSLAIVTVGAIPPNMLVLLMTKVNDNE